MNGKMHRSVNGKDKTENLQRGKILEKITLYSDVINILLGKFNPFKTPLPQILNFFKISLSFFSLKRKSWKVFLQIIII